MPDTPRPITQHHRAAVALLIMFDLRLANEAVEVMPGQRVDDHIVRLALDDPAAFVDAIRTARGTR